MNIELKEYGILKNAKISEKYANGNIESVKVEGLSILKINGKEFIPRYSDFTGRRKELPSVRLYKSGKIKSIDLENETIIKTSSEKIFKAEKVMFYETGKIKKIFPLNGKLSGYWTEEDEYKKCQIYSFKFKCSEFSRKIISVSFFNSGEIKSVSLWPQDKITIKYNDRKIIGRAGISFYENGELETCEPLYPVSVKTPIGNLEAFSPDIIGLHGENNSLKFYPDGKIKALKEMSHTIKVADKYNKIHVFSPKEEILFAGSDIKTSLPVEILFENDKVIINKTSVFCLNECRFILENYGEKKLTLGGDLLRA